MVKDFFSRLFPKDLVAYIPGQKLIAAAIVSAITVVVGNVGAADTTEILGVPVSIPALIAAVSYYLWPEN